MTKETTEETTEEKIEKVRLLFMALHDHDGGSVNVAVSSHRVNGLWLWKAQVWSDGIEPWSSGIRGESVSMALNLLIDKLFSLILQRRGDLSREINKLGQVLSDGRLENSIPLPDPSPHDDD